MNMGDLTRFHGDRGQMSEAERLLLHKTITHFRPDEVVEIGTGNGRGSTWFILNAMDEVGRGHLTSFEIVKERCDEALTYHGSNTRLTICNCRAELTPKTDLCLFDGSDDQHETMQQFMSGADTLKVAIFHDWNATKCARIRQILPNDRWHLLWLLTYDNGMACFGRDL
jgi:hypothetical protein